MPPPIRGGHNKLSNAHQFMQKSAGWGQVPLTDPCGSMAGDVVTNQGWKNLGF